MNALNLKKKIIIKNALIIGLSILFLITPHGNTAKADHVENPCENIDRLIEEVSTGYFSRPIVSTPAGIFVPVYDAAVASAIRSLGGRVDATGEQLERIEEQQIAANLELEKSVLLLKLLCDKEYNEDHNLQHAWRNTISDMVSRTMNWINTAYLGNPMYVLNPYMYYRNIEIGVINSFVWEVAQHINDDDIDGDAGRNAIRLILRQAQDAYVGTGVLKDWTGYGDPQADLDKAIYNDPNRFSWGSHYSATQVPLNNPSDLSAFLVQELETRKEQVRSIEAQKLAWGRGFFPWEYCGQDVFSEASIDIRTCMTFTPGSVVQDVSTWIITSGLRQMELADEYEEWVSGAAYAAIDNIYSINGLYISGQVIDEIPADLKRAIPPDDIGDLVNSLIDSDQLTEDWLNANGLELNVSKAAYDQVDFINVP